MIGPVKAGEFAVRGAAGAALFACLSTAAPESARAQTEVCPALKQVASIPLVRTRDGQSWVPAQVNGQPHLFKLDTAGVITSLYPEAADALELPVNRGRQALVDINGRVSNRAARIVGFELGGLKFEDLDFMVLPSRNPGFVNNRRAGFLALDLLKSYDIEVDFGQARLNLFSPEHCDGRVVYWQTDAVAEIPIDFDSQGKPRVAVTLDGVKLSAVLDTGANTTVLNQSVGESRLGVDIDDPDVRKITLRDTVIYRKEFKLLEMAGLQVANPEVTIQPDRVKPVVRTDAPVFPGSSIRAYSEDMRLPDLLIGTSILNKLHIYLATREKKLYVSAASEPAPAMN